MKKDKIYYIVILFFILALLVMRPTLFGQELSVVGVSLLIFSAALYYVLVNFHDYDKDSYNCYYIALAQIFFWIYCLFISTVIGNSNMDYVYKGFVLQVCSSVVFGYLFSNKCFREDFFRIFAKINAIAGFSIFVTFILLLFLNKDQITVGQVVVKGYSDSDTGNGSILFPFSIMYGELTEYGITRYLGFYRESGIAQAFFVWAFVYLLYIKQSAYYIAGAFLGSLLCGSSSVVISYGCTLIVWFSFRKGMGIKGNLVFFLAIIGLIFLAIYAPGLGLNDKMETHGASAEDRQLAILYAFDYNENIFFGNGLHYLFAPYEGLGINSISYVYYYGVVGLFLYSAQFVCFPALNGTKIRLYLLFLAPFFLMAFLFQPLIDAPLVYAMCYCFPGNDIRSLDRFK
jgi:hypothetical protein